MKTLLDLPNKSKQAFDYSVFPRKMTWEEKRTVYTCKLYTYSVSRFACWQCKHFEVHAQMTTTLTKQCGHCVWPKHASKLSRQMTADVERKLTGVEPTEEQKIEQKQKRVKSLAIARERRKESGKDGVADKVAFAVSYLKQNPDKSALLSALIAKYTTLSDAYCNTIYYAARKQVPSVAAKPVDKEATLEYKVRYAAYVYKKTNDRDTVVRALQKKWPAMSHAYCVTLFYRARKEA